MTAIPASAGRVGAQAPIFRRAPHFTGHASTIEVPVVLTSRALECLVHLAVTREMVMRETQDADPREAVAMGEAVRALQAAWMADREGGA